MSILPVSTNRIQSPINEKDQIKPLSHTFITQEDEAISTEMKQYHNKRWLIWCGVVSAMILIISVTLLVLAFTIFRVKDPTIKINSVTFQGLDFVKINSSNLNPGTNLTVMANVSVRNPNVASFKFNNVTTMLYYNGTVIGEATTPPGLAKARKTIFVDVTMVVLVDRFLAVPRLQNDLIAGMLPVSSYTEVRGKVKIVIKKHIEVKMNCTMTIDIKNMGAIKDQNCKKRIST